MPQDLPVWDYQKTKKVGGGLIFTDSMLIQTTTCLITRKQFPLKNLSSVVGSPQRRGSRRTTKPSVSSSHCSAAPVFASPFTCLWLIAAEWIAELPSISPSVLPSRILSPVFLVCRIQDRPLFPAEGRNASPPACLTDCCLCSVSLRLV